ncbi:prolyl oligopeptidase family serine peptidase [Novosphingobium sp.]|uniref:prolyl oligopeptidase family serine peptidase n=1 Tax=Novosphingobium sp. TaxID=1874826 RepID=UPI0033428BAE
MTDPAHFPPLLPYPPSPQVPLVEHVFGETVSDPWRWLEADVRHDDKVAQWVAGQSAFAENYLSALPERATLAARMQRLSNYERYGVPVQRGHSLFYRWNAGLMNQAQLLVADAAAPVGPQGRVLLDPQSWSADGATALDAWAPSDDGSLVAYTVQDGGSDWRSVRVVRVADGTVLPDTLKWVKFSDLAWIGNDTLVYSRFADPGKDAAFQALNYNQTVWLHRLGTSQSADVQVYATPATPKRGHGASTSSDGRWLVIASTDGTDPVNAVHVAAIDQARIGTVQPLVADLTAQWTFIDAVGDSLWFISGEAAPRRKVVRVDLARDGGTPPKFTTVVPEHADTLAWAGMVGGRLVLGYLHDAHSRVVHTALDGSGAQDIDLPGLGSVEGISGRASDAQGHMAFASFTTPATVLRFDAATGRATPWRALKLTFDPAAYRVELVFAPSRDGTRVPLFVVRRADATGPVPTLLYGYGGFNVSMSPWFSPTTMAWLESGGAYALAILRGGGEYGDAWHDAGRLTHKQNVFDDFIAAGEWLIGHGVCPKNGLAIQGHSNGGLLVGAVVNQRPDLFAAANAGVGVMDMLRFDRFTAGRYWVDDYGHPDIEADWRVLRAYSPYHNIRGGVAYPAVLVTTADTDDRVVPGHSFKYAAALQTADTGPKPHLIRIETRAGHGSGKPLDKQIAEEADVQAFLAHWTGLQPRA